MKRHDARRAGMLLTVLFASLLITGTGCASAPSVQERYGDAEATAEEEVDASDASLGTAEVEEQVEATPKETAETRAEAPNFEDGVLESGDNAMNFAYLLTNLMGAYESSYAVSWETIESNLASIQATSANDYEIARAIADHWQRTYLDPTFTLYLYGGGQEAPELAQAGVSDSPAHAFVVLGYELENGEMAPELMRRCDAAAVAARSYPNTILVCSGGPTGQNNPEQHTEAGLMKDYLAGVCGIEESRILTDERAMDTTQNALNTMELLRQNGVSTMTIVTSSYQQRWGQAVYNAAAELYRAKAGYDVAIEGNYNYDTAATPDVAGIDDLIAIHQIAELLRLPQEALDALPYLPPDN